MKFILIDDEHELYKHMFADCFKESKYNIEEIPRMQIPGYAKTFYTIHFSDKINRRIWLRGKMLIWKKCYKLHKYAFDSNDRYCVLFMNGSLRYHFSKQYLDNFKRDHPNVKLVMIMYDSFSNPTAKRAISMIPVFDYVFSFDMSVKFLDMLTPLLEFLLAAYTEEGKSVVVIGIGCTGGRHRSTAIAAELADRIGAMGYETLLFHRDVDKG